LEDRPRTATYAQGLSELRARPTAHGKTDRLQGPRRAPGPPGVRRRGLGQPFGENLAPTSAVITEKPAHLSGEADGQAVPRQIGQSPGVATMDAPGRRATQGTGHDRAAPEPPP